MTKKNIIISFYCIYITFLFIVAINYTVTEESVKGFGTGLGTGLIFTFYYLAIAFLSSFTFLIIAGIIHKKLSLLFILFAPFANITVGIVVTIIINFILWITQLQEAVNIFEKIFLIAAISTTATSLWLLNDMFKTGSKNRYIIKKSLEK